MVMTVLSAFDGRAQRKDGTFYDVVKKSTFLTKTITPSKKYQANNLDLYQLTGEHDPQSLVELEPILKDLLDDQHSMVIRYKYQGNPSVGSLLKRRADLTYSVPSPIIALDIDDLDLPSWIGATDLVAQGEYVVRLLHRIAPDFFPETTGFIAQASSSAGLVQKVKLHLWLENDIPVTQATLKSVFADFNRKYKTYLDGRRGLVDLALYSAVQPHYLARPNFYGISDPFPAEKRMVFVSGVTCKIPQLYTEEALDDTRVTAHERQSYLNMITGSMIKSARLDAMIEKLRFWPKEETGARLAVIAIYHTAVQECYDLDLLDKEIKRILQRIRPGNESDYVEQGRAASLNKIVQCSERKLPDQVLGLPVETVEALDGFYLRLDKAPPDNTTLFLKASLGTGKTQNVADILRDFKGSFLSVTNTVALVESNAARFQAGLYNNEQDLQNLADGTINRMCCTLHSLQKLPKHNFDLVFIDECDAVMHDLLFASIIDDAKRYQIISALEEILYRSNVIILSDGDISQETMEAYVHLQKGQKHLQKIVHIRENLANGLATKHKSIESLLGAMEGSIASGEKCILVSDLSPDKLNSFYHTFRRTLPNKVGVVMHAHSKDDDAFVDIVNNTTTALKRRGVDYLLCSPSITNGVDFNFFDTIFVVTTTMNHSPNLRFQALKRERKSNNIHFYFSRLKGYTSGYGLVPTPEDWLGKFRKLYALRKERECANYINTFNHYLIKSGCKIYVEDIPYSNPQIAEDKMLAIEERAIAIMEGVSKARNNDAPEVKKIVDFFLGEQYTLNDVVSFIKNREYEKAAYLNLVIKDFWYVLKFSDASLLLKELYTEKGALWNYLTGDSIPKREYKKVNRIKMTEDLLDRCGLLKDSKKGIENYKKYCKYNSIAPIEECEIKTHDI